MRGCWRRRSSASPTSTPTTAARPSPQGNARVLAARLSDARFFWEQDLKIPLEEQAQKLSGIVFHEKLGTVADKVERVAKLARWLVEEGVVKGADADQAERAARLAKADLVTGMVGEFPELQGVIGGYLAEAQGEPKAVADAIRDHYKPVGQGDEVPTAPVTVAVSAGRQARQSRRASSSSTKSPPARRIRSRCVVRHSESIESDHRQRAAPLSEQCGDADHCSRHDAGGRHTAMDRADICDVPHRPAEGATARRRRSARLDRRGCSRWSGRTIWSAARRVKALQQFVETRKAPTCSPPTSARPTS